MADLQDDNLDAIPDGTPYQSLYRRFRPSTFAEVKGQDHVVLALRNAVRDGRTAHAYLFSGPRGTGKTSTARILAKALNCTDLRHGEPCGECSSCIEIAKGTSLDVHELDAASNNGVDAMRDLVSRAALGSPGRQKVYIVDEVHMLSTPASNALLKTLEEPPPHVIFVLATTDPQKVLPTIRSRTQHYEFRLLGADTLGELLNQVRRDAQLDVGDEAIDVAVRRGRGSARDALSVLDQAATSDTVEDDLPELDEIVEALAERDAGRALAAVAHLTSAGFSPQQLTGDLIDLLRQGFLALVAPELAGVVETERDTIGEVTERLGLPALVRSIEVLGRSQVDMREALDARVNLEVALVRLAHPEADESPEAMLVRIERLERLGRQPGDGGAPASPPAPAVAPSPTTPPVTPDPVGATGAPPTPTPARKTVGAVQRESAPPAPSAPTAAPADPPPAGSDASPASPPPPAGPPTRSEAAPDSARGFPTRDQLVQAWGDHILGRLRPKAKALYQAGRFIGAGDGRAVFGLPNDTHRERCEAIRGDVEPALTEYFGLPVELSLVVEGQAGGRAEDGAPAGTGRGIPTPLVQASPPSGGAPVPGDDDEDAGDMASFRDAEVGAVVTNSAEARVLEAFPGAEEIL
ncbi:MAG TPA: DNA polymerase III subunit gamma/tau [Acidimicrobiales bacterium]|nr:DNA polymerase III subunit gamma/tau [Acidimicrobiales bacterium]